ncbi:MAG: phospholipase D-like domain-containing protein [Polyangiales bacterium]|nr:hypothetical protein [Myxococcales bacterium]
MLAACAADGVPGTSDLGDFGPGPKGDGVHTRSITFSVRGARSEDDPGKAEFKLRSWGELSLDLEQRDQTNPQRLQIVAESDSLTRRSGRGRAPSLTVDEGRRGYVDYVVTILNWGDAKTGGTMTVGAEVGRTKGVEVEFNNPDCDDCDNKAGNMHKRLLKAIGQAQVSIDLAIFGFQDPEVLGALCAAVENGVELRVVTDNDSLEEGPRSYYPYIFGEEGSLRACGAKIVPVMSMGIMHHKFLIIDKDTETEQLVSGSANFSDTDFVKHHNHMVFMRGVPELVEAYQNEFDQLYTRCQVDRITPMDRCTECTPGCTEDRSEEGPWDIADGSVTVEFSPSDDALGTLRGKVIDRSIKDEDVACRDEDADCWCRETPSGKWNCTYCAAEGHYGLIGEAQRSIRLDVFAATDPCLALGLAKARSRGIEIKSVWDMVNAANPYSEDEYLCSQGIETYVTNWSGGNPLAFNHNKLVVVDDIVFDGSMNLSSNGADVNNENTLIFRSPKLAYVYASYVDSEIQLLKSHGVKARTPSECRCAIDASTCDNTSNRVIFAKPTN